MSCGVGCRHGSDVVLLWLWCRPAAVAPIRPAWEPPHAAGAALKKKKKKKKKLFTKDLKATFMWDFVVSLCASLQFRCEVCCGHLCHQQMDGRCSNGSLLARGDLTNSALGQYFSLMSLTTYFSSLSISAVLKSDDRWHFSPNQNVKLSLIWQ